jgi:hypothetical protein
VGPAAPLTSGPADPFLEAGPSGRLTAAWRRGLVGVALGEGLLEGFRSMRADAPGTAACRRGLVGVALGKGRLDCFRSMRAYARGSE